MLGLLMGRRWKTGILGVQIGGDNFFYGDANVDSDVQMSLRVRFDGIRVINNMSII